MDRLGSCILIAAICDIFAELPGQFARLVESLGLPYC
jgi:hypothetical protein